MSAEPRVVTATPSRTFTIWLATAASYGDRLAAFVLPMLVLRSNSDPQAYAAVEFVISVSVILATFFDGGLRNFVLFHARESGDPTLTTERTLLGFVPVYALQLAAIGLGLLPWLTGAGSADGAGLLAIGVVRGAALSILGLATQLLILHGRPATGTLVSLSGWLIGAFSFALPETASVTLRTSVFFGSAFLLVGLAALLLWQRTNLKITSEGRRHLGVALAWGWPLLAAAAASMLVAHFSRVYAFASLPMADMVGFTFWLRVFSIVQLSHSALAAVFSPEIFNSRESGVDRANLRRYATYMAPPVVLALAIALMTPVLAPGLPPLAIQSVLAIGVYVVLWCAGAYLEIYLTRDSRTSRVMTGAVAAGGLFCALLLFAPPKEPFRLALFMCASAAMHLTIVSLSLKRGR
jgi:hypothetical protein